LRLAREQHIRDHGLTGETLRARRQAHARPVLEGFFDWVDTTLNSQGLLPSSPLTKTMAYARERREALGVYLDDTAVPIDTNHIERTLRVIPMGRRS